MSELESDALALALARRLVAADFSAESRVRYSLRARLLGQAPVRAPAHPALAARVLVAWALAALILFIPIRRALRHEPRFPVGENGLPVLPGRLVAQVGDKAEPIFETSAPQDIFERRTVDKVIQLSQPKTLSGEGASAIVWEVEGDSYVLERRRTSLEEIFVTTTL